MPVGILHGPISEKGSPVLAFHFVMIPFSNWPFNLVLPTPRLQEDS